MSTQFKAIRRKPALLAILALAICGTVFLSGALVARATVDAGDTPTPAAAGHVVAPGIAVDGSANTALQGAPDVAGSKGGGTGSAPAGPPSTAYGPGGCPAPIGDVISGSTIDPAKVGLTPVLLAAGFQLESVSLHADGSCGTDATAPAQPALDTSWLHTKSGAQVMVSQRIAKEQVANVMLNGIATFWAGGYNFAVNAFGGPIAVESTPGTKPPAPPPGIDDATLTAVIDEAIAQLAPSLGLQCFYRQTQGGWGDLAKLGIGDPRPAIPAGLVEQNLIVQTFTPPAAGCNTPAFTDGGTFSVSFQGPQDNQGGNFIALGASPVPEGQLVPGPGGFGPGGGSWTSGHYQFYINGVLAGGQMLTVEQVTAIATALDPNFANACLALPHTLTSAEIAARGLHEPQAPNDYTLSSSSLTVTQLSAGCNGSAPNFVENVNLSWTFTGGDGAIIQASANRYGKNGGPTSGVGAISNSNISWWDGAGTNYSVFGSAKGSSLPSRDALIVVATSMDPSLDISKLSVQPDGGGKGGPPPPVQVLPAPASTLTY